ncbi:flagellar basal-body rod protein FlgF [Shewanella sp. NFH-SH190041]|uniref:flagellar basal-body rod protein FlgF n=1 Tax=Shewanella sp. NFH-SH190041 TaxID=2950245 RepID=UPI0021C377BF|nr:flagellar basal-body rod protein FlgF [Shewanella sp. NFH-SH190041]BDM62719.1 flagellar basal-body rod protein FlgF [Shewanella sp. NFH-SH190041]
MDKMIYTAAQGANRILQAQTIRANNLANANTPGFKADLERVQAVKVDTVAAALPTRVMAETTDAGYSSRNGVADSTGRPLDLAINGKGMFSVQTPEGEAYTRNGSLVADAEGQLTIDGHPVLGNGGPIVLPAYQAINISRDGSISIATKAGAPMEEVAQLKLVSPTRDELHKGENGLFYAQNNGRLAASDDIEVQSGALEGSNVDAVSELIASMDLNRQFEIQVKLMKSADRMADASNRLLQNV